MLQQVLRKKASAASHSSGFCLFHSDGKVPRRPGLYYHCRPQPSTRCNSYTEAPCPFCWRLVGSVRTGQSVLGMNSALCVKFLDHLFSVWSWVSLSVPILFGTLDGIRFLSITSRCPLHCCFVTCFFKVLFVRRGIILEHRHGR